MVMHPNSFFSGEELGKVAPCQAFFSLSELNLFARALKKDPSIKGINVGQKEIKITQYADDTTVLVRDCDSVLRLLELLEEFKRVSGLEINTSKTEAMWLGTWKNRKEKPFGFKWPDDPVLALGISFTYDSERAWMLNLEEKIDKLEKTLSCWKRRNLTLMIKINIVKTLGLSKLIYSASVLTMSRRTVERINRIIFNFIWDGKPAKIKKKTIIAERKYGGLKMIDFELMEKSLKIAWIKRFAENNHAAWKIIPEHTLSQHGGISFFTQCQYDMQLFDLQNLPDFYRTILNYWQNFKLLTDNDKAAQNQIIWNNSNILVDGKPILYNSWLINGIMYIKDLLAEDKNFLSLADLKAKFNLNVPLTTYYGVLNAIPANWKKSIQNTDVQRGLGLVARLPSTKTAYSIILSNSYSTPMAENKILNYGFTKDNIQNVYMLPFQILKEAKLIFFQFKIIHDILPTQSNLFRAGIKDTYAPYAIPSASL